MGQPVQINDVDRAFYRERLEAFLPSRLVDIHTHVWQECHKAMVDHRYRAATWPLRVAREQSMADLQETYRLMFPGKRVTPLIFGFSTSARDDLEANNAYVAKAARTARVPALIFAHPQWTAEELELRTIAGGFLGAKVYLTLADAAIPEKEIRIFDFLPHHQLEVLNRHGWIVMLHVPRDGRLRDATNLGQMLEIERRYPNIRLIIAHVGRAYCPEDLGDAFEVLGQTQRMLFDFSANTNAKVFAELIRCVGPQRILFGSDLPITRMRMRRVCERGNYVNLVPRELYGDVSGDSHMREVDGGEAAGLSLFLYEEIDAFRQAAEATGLGRGDIDGVFCGNALRIVREAGGAIPTLENT